MARNHVTKVLCKHRKKLKRLDRYDWKTRLFTLILNARLNPDAKNPPNGPITELNTLMDSECNRNGYIVIDLLILN